VIEFTRFGARLWHAKSVRLSRALEVRIVSYETGASLTAARKSAGRKSHDRKRR
jgi:hypothetical protein